jgi:WD40 repeat protein
MAPAGQAAYTRTQIESLMERKGSPFQRNTAGFSNQVRSVWAVDAHSLEPATVVALADNGEFHVYDRETWNHLFTWGKHKHQVNWSGNSFWNGTAVVVGGRNLSFCRITGDDKSVKTLNVSAPGLCDGLSVVGLMHHAQQAVVATNEKLGLIDLETGRAIRNIKSDTGSVYSLQAVPNCPGLAVAMLSSGAIKVWDLNTSSDSAIKQFTGLGPHPRGLHFNPTNPNQFIAGSYDKVRPCTHMHTRCWRRGEPTDTHLHVCVTRAARAPV